MTINKRYSVRAWLSFDVGEGETAKEVLDDIEASLNKGHAPVGVGFYVGVDDVEVDRRKGTLGLAPDDIWEDA